MLREDINLRLTTCKSALYFLLLNFTVTGEIVCITGQSIGVKWQLSWRAVFYAGDQEKLILPELKSRKIIA